MNMPQHVLVVDDEANIRLVFRTALESAGCRVSTAADGAEALDGFARDPADLVLLDLQMPVMGGMEVLRRLRDAGLDVPVMIVTAHGSVPDAVDAMKLGAIDFVAKPVAAADLRNLVADVLVRHAPESRSTAPQPEGPGPATAASLFAADLRRAKHALNRRAFDEAEAFLKQAIALQTSSAEAHNLMGVLHEVRKEHDASYREYKAALKADRHYEPAQNNMRRYYERFTFGRSDVPLDAGH